MKIVRVGLGPRSYPILIGRGAAARVPRALGERGRAFIVADQRLKAQTQAFVKTLERAGWESHLVRVPATESFKDFKRIYPLYAELLKAKADRHTIIFALGGGVIGDAAGFLAGT